MNQNIRENILVDPYNVVFVDRVNDNFLFRGPNPVVKNQPPDQTYSFDYGGLTTAIGVAAERAGQTLPWPYHLIDINLLQWENANEVPMILTEYNFFQYAQGLGEFHFWETNGTGLCAVEPPLSEPAVQDYLAKNLGIWLTDNLADQPPDQNPGRMQQLSVWLNAENVLPNVIYAHCEGGMDRTGELMGAYYLRFMKKTWAEMNCLNYQIGNRPFGCNNYRAVLWYAIYLNKVFNYNIDYNEAFPCADPDGPHYGCGDASTNPNPTNPWADCESS